MIKQEDIAKRLNISRTTVARALNGSKNIRPETKEKILGLCKELGYVKNPISSSLATKKQKKIYAFVIKSKNRYYTEELIHGLKAAEKEFKFYGYKINIVETDIEESEKQLIKLKQTIQEENPEGIIITPLIKDKIKEIIINNPKIFFLTLDSSIDKSIFHIGVDYYKSGRIAADIFINIINSDSKILVLDTLDDKISSKLYMNGFLDRMYEEKDDYIIGPVYDDNLSKNINKILEKYFNKDIQGIYSTRFLLDIVENINKYINSPIKVVGNGMGDSMKRLILEKKIIATVVEKWREEGYLAGKFMFEYFYKNHLPKKRHTVIKGEILFRENLL